MKIALISDIHGNLPALEAVYQSILEKDITEIYNLGDSLYGPLWPEETAQFLIEKNIRSIMGNGDEDILNNASQNETLRYTANQLSEKSINWLKTLPMIFKNKDITLFHGSPSTNSKYFFFFFCDGNIILKSNLEIIDEIKNIKTKYIAFGHSHIERILNIDDYILINAGSVGLPAYSDDEPVHNIETYNNFAKYVIINKENIEIRYVEYDYKLASKQAKKNNRNDWSNWIKNGRVK
jgi:putative phosphoesterase